MTPTTSICEFCLPYQRVALIRQASTGNLLCPRCMRASAEAPTTRVAQFGGGGASGGQFTPGSNPYGKGGGSIGSPGFNERVVDEGLDAIMSRTRKNYPDDPERNLEARLEIFHDYVEDDTIPYHLTLEERARLKLRKELRRRERYYQDCARSIEQNSVGYIKENFPLQPEHAHTIEELLESRHRIKPSERDPREDESPAQIRPTRRHTVSQNILRQPGRMHGENDLDEEVVNDPMNAEQFREHNLPMGETTTINSNADFDDQLDQLAKDDWGGETTGPNVTTMTGNYPSEDRIGPHNAPPTPSLGKVYPDDSPAINNPGVGLEGQLQSLNTPLPTAMPQDPYSYDHREDEILGQGKEPMSIWDKYNDKGAGGYGNGPMPKLARRLHVPYQIVEAKQNIEPDRVIDVRKVKLSHSGGMTEPQIADAFNIPIGMVRFIVRSWHDVVPVSVGELEAAWSARVNAAPQQLPLPMGKLPPKTTKPDPDRYFRNKVFHGTARDNAADIKKHGLIPQTGDFIREMYDGSYDDDDEFDNPDNEATYFARWPDIDRAFTAMQYAVAKKLGKSVHDITPQEVAQYGLLMTAPYNDNMAQRQHGSDYSRAWNEESGDFDGQEDIAPAFSESGDVFSTNTVQPKGYYQGQRLQKLWKRWRDQNPQQVPPAPTRSAPQAVEDPVLATRDAKRLTVPYRIVTSAEADYVDPNTGEITPASEIYTLYHGTKERGLKARDLRPSEAGYSGVLGDGIYFTPQQQMAEIYSRRGSGEVLKARARLRNPLVIDAAEGTNYRIAPEIADKYHESGSYDTVMNGLRIPPFDVRIGDEWYEIRDRHDLHRITQWARTAGHDSLIARGYDENHPEDEETVLWDTSTLMPDFEDDDRDIVKKGGYYTEADIKRLGRGQ